MERESISDERLEPLYDELRLVAQAYFRRQAPGFTLCPTEIVHEAYLHLVEHGHVDWTSTGHFRAIAIHKMWQVVVDHLRRRHAQKRNGRVASFPESNGEVGDGHGRRRGAYKRLPLEAVTVAWHDRDVDLLDLADALADLGQASRRLRDVVMLHWFGRLTHAEVAQALGVSQSTAEKDFRYALAWLNRRLQENPLHDDHLSRQGA